MHRQTTALTFTVAAVMAVLTATAQASGVLPNTLAMDKSFSDDASLEQTRMTMAWDGTNYWSSSGGDTSGNRLSRYDASGALLNTYAPGLDMRSVFTGPAGGTLYARQYNDATIYRQTAPGTFASDVSLVGGTLDEQSAVVFNTAGTEYVAQISGVVSRWDTAGNHLGDVALSGYGTMHNENDYPQQRTIGVWNGYYLTYSEAFVSAWDGAGNRVGMAELLGAGTSFDSYFSFSYAADGRIWVVDEAASTWRGYPLVPEPCSLVLLGIGAMFSLGARHRRLNAVLD